MLTLGLVFVLTISVGISDKPEDAPPGPWVSDFALTSNPDFTTAASALSSLVFAYAGTPAFFSIVSEMREPRHYIRSLIICQSVVTITYITIGVVVYYYCGSYVTSPALGSAGQLIKRVCYGLALPGLLVTMTIVLHVCCLPLRIVGRRESLSFAELTCPSCQPNSSSSACCKTPDTCRKTR